LVTELDSSKVSAAIIWLRSVEFLHSGTTRLFMSHWKMVSQFISSAGLDSQVWGDFTTRVLGVCQLSAPKTFTLEEVTSLVMGRDNYEPPVDPVRPQMAVSEPVSSRQYDPRRGGRPRVGRPRGGRGSRPEVSPASCERSR
jgi:hypothetical protein